MEKLESLLKDINEKFDAFNNDSNFSIFVINLIIK